MARGGDGLGQSEFDKLLDPKFSNDHLTVEGAAVYSAPNRPQSSAERQADLSSAEAANIHSAAANLGLTTEEYESAREAGQLSPASGNPGQVNRL